MKCPFCEHLDNKVVDSRISHNGDITRRRRECLDCGSRFTTYERVEEVMPLVVKKDGRREEFDREKILEGLRIACRKRKFAAADFEEMEREVELRIQSLGVREVPSHEIGRFVMETLHSRDKVAYIRFASVYREFKDVKEFLSELQKESLSSGTEEKAPPKLGNYMRRRKSREFALQVLFGLENQADEFIPDPSDAQMAVSTYLKNFAPKNFEEIADIPYLLRLLTGILADLTNIDALIEKYSEHWKLYRMTKIDRNVLRIGVEELKNFPDIPPKVTLDECVELAKRFGNDDSSAFVNGILDKTRHSLGRMEES